MYLPTIGKTPSGLLYEADPVQVLEPQATTLATALEVALSRPPLAIPDWPDFQGASGQSVVQVAAGFKSWRSFAKAALGIALIDDGDRWQVSVGEGLTQGDVETLTMERGAAPYMIAESITEIANRRTLWQDK